MAISTSTRRRPAAAKEAMTAAGPLGLAAAVIDQALEDAGRDDLEGIQARRWLAGQEPYPALTLEYCLDAIGIDRGSFVELVRMRRRPVAGVNNNGRSPLPSP